MVLRSAPPPDFRYVGLRPGPSSRVVRVLSTGVGVGTFTLGIGLCGAAEPATVGAAAAAGGIAALLCARLSGPTARSSHQAPLAIVPWGVLVESASMPRVLRWSAVREVKVDVVCDMDNATPRTRWSIVTIRTDRELFAGRAPGMVPLDRLEAYLEKYAEESARPPATDLDGHDCLELTLEPGFELLLAEGRRLIQSGELCQRLGLEPASYRAHRARRASSDVIAKLRQALSGDAAGPADPRALAAIVAAELGTVELRDALVGFVTSPSPLLAAVARAAALRLGAPPKCVGAIDEVRDFLPATDLEQIRGWAYAPA